jgi:pimeloyl-ACP methyl ester carboxylesterase
MGFGAGREYWHPLIDAIHERFPGRYTTCCYDQRGMGGSSAGGWLTRTTTTSLARDVLGLMLHLGWAGANPVVPVHLVGWSMGGFACIELLCALQKLNVSPTQVFIMNIASLTLCNTAHKATLPALSGEPRSITCVARAHYSHVHARSPLAWGHWLSDEHACLCDGV